DVPSVYLDIAPYILTIIVLVVFIGRAQAPKALGKTFVQSK
ncbi:ABC transporter permease, partial [Aerococcus sp. L_4]